MEKVYICIPIFNRINFTINCLKSICSQSYKNFQIIICDDGSTDGSSEIISNLYPEVIIIPGTGNLWWTGATNLSVKKALEIGDKSDFILTLNNDTEIENNTIEELVSFSIAHRRVIVGAINLFFNNRNLIEPSAFKAKGKGFLPLFHFRIHNWGDDIRKYSATFSEVNSLSGKGVLFPIEVFNTVGLYDEKALPHYHADSVFTRKANDYGFKIFLNYKAKVYSHQSLSGIGTITSNPKILEFIKSFFVLKSPNHFITLYNRAKIIYKDHYLIYLIFNLIAIIGGFAKRWFYFHLDNLKSIFKKI
jgi:GT2 family glycosyltransferase